MSVSINLTKKQSQNGGFLGLLASLGIPIISSLIGNLIDKWSGLQIERSCRKPLYGDGLRTRTSNQLFYVSDQRVWT